MALLSRAAAVDPQRLDAVRRAIDWHALEGKPYAEAKRQLSACFQGYAEVYQEPYRKKIWRQAFASQLIRGAALIAGLVGAATPCIAAFQTDDHARWITSSVGVAVLLASSVALLVDQVFGYSRSLIRFSRTVETLNDISERKKDDLEALSLTWKESLTNDDVIAAHKLFQSLGTEIRDAQKAETELWAADVDTRIEALGQFVKDQRQVASQGAADAAAASVAKRPGGIELEFQVPTGASVSVELDGEPVGTTKGASFALTGVKPGVRKLSVKVVDGARETTEQASVAVKPGEVEKRTFRVPPAPAKPG